MNKRKDSETLTEAQLKPIAKQPINRVTFKMRKTEIVESISKTLNFTFRNEVASVINFLDSII